MPGRATWTPERRARQGELLRALIAEGRCGSDRPSRRVEPAECAVCFTTEGLLHFALSIEHRFGGRRTMRGAGAIDLCERCWARATHRGARQRRKARKAGRVG